MLTRALRATRIRKPLTTTGRAGGINEMSLLFDAAEDLGIAT
jgi:hypothetical protein